MEIPTGPAARKPPATLTVHGVVIEGVEHGSVVLQAVGDTFQLGPRFAEHIGHRVKVTGHVQEGVMTIQQQGKPFAVDTLEVLDLAD